MVGDIEKSERRLSRTNYHDYHDYCQLKIIVLFQIVQGRNCLFAKMLS